MKKRLLSALLAFIMVLTMLPATVFAETAGDGTGGDQTTQTTPEETKPETTVTTPAAQPNNVPAARSMTTADSSHNGWSVTYITKTNSDWGIGIDDIPGYFAHKKVLTTDKFETYVKVTSGFVYSNKYYAALNDLPTTVAGNLTSNIMVFGNQSGPLPNNVTSATLEIYQEGSLSITGGAKLTSLTVKNSRSTGTATLSGINNCDLLANLTLENVDASSVAINESSLVTNNTRTIKLTNSKLGAVTMVGKGTYTDANGRSTQVDRARNIQATNSEIGAITITGSSSTIKLTDTSVGSGSGTITLASNGGSINIDGKSQTGEITIGALDAKKTYPTITIGGTASVGGIKEDTSNPSADTATATVTINGAGAHVGTTVFNSANVTITAGFLNHVTLHKGGKVVVNGKNITVGGVSLENTGELSVSGSWNAADSNSGSYNTVGTISAATGNVTLTIPNDPTNTYGSGSGDYLDKYTKKNIMGGTWKFSVPKDALSTTLVYYLVDDVTNATEFTYYTAAQLGDALNKQVEESKTGNWSGALRVTGQNYDTAQGVAIGQVRFMNGATSWGMLQVSAPMQITLPTMINNVKLSSWSDGSHTYTLPSTYTVPTVEKMPNDDNGTKYVELNANGGVNTGDVTKLTKVEATANNGDYVGGSVRATLNGNVINLSGAVNSGTSMITLTLTTDAVEKDNGKDVPVTLDVGVTYFSGTNSLTFENVGTTALGKGVTLETDSSGLGVLRLSNGTKYTLNGSGLKVRSNIKVANFDTGVAYGIQDYSFIETTVNAPTIRTDADKQTIIDMFSGTNGGFDWTNSPAIKQAINNALSTITQSQVDNWLAQVQREAWTKVNTGTYNAANNAADSGYDEVWLVPYLQVTVTGYSTNGTMTFTAVPSWRVEVRQSQPVDNAYGNAFYDAKKVDSMTNRQYVKVVKTGTSLGQLTGNMGDSDDLTTGATLKVTHGFPGVIYLHQDNTYAYEANNGVYTITHAGSGNNGLGTMVLNTTVPLVTLYPSVDGNGNPSGTKIASYDNLQAAVDDTKDGNHINVDQKYTGSMNVNVTGFARKFTIQANGNNVVVANASGGLVDLNSTGGQYTVQLNRDNTAVTDPNAASIAVTSVTGGSAVVSATSAKAGTTITVTCTPASGYRTNGVSVSAHMTSTNTNSAVTVTRSSENVYTFKVPEGASSITVTPTFVLNTGMPFTDVATTDYYYNAVKYVYDNGLMNGNNTTGTLFDGNATLSRAMVVTILYRAAGSPSVSNYSGFNDVVSNTWYSQAVTWASQNKVVEGYGNGTFLPNNAISRQELATILYRYNTNYKGRATTGSTSLANYTDQAYVSSWATAGMQWAVGNGIVTGTTTTTLTPGGNASRYQAATMLMRYGQNFGL